MERCSAHWVVLAEGRQKQRCACARPCEPESVVPLRAGASGCCPLRPASEAGGGQNVRTAAGGCTWTPARRPPGDTSAGFGKNAERRSCSARRSRPRSVRTASSPCRRGWVLEHAWASRTGRPRQAGGTRRPRTAGGVRPNHRGEPQRQKRHQPASQPAPSPLAPAPATAAHPRHTASCARLQGSKGCSAGPEWQQLTLQQGTTDSVAAGLQPACPSGGLPSMTAAGTACSPSALNCLPSDGAWAAAIDANRGWPGAAAGRPAEAALQQLAAAAAGRSSGRPGRSWRCRVRVACVSSS